MKHKSKPKPQKTKITIDGEIPLADALAKKLSTINEAKLLRLAVLIANLDNSVNKKL